MTDRERNIPMTTSTDRTATDATEDPAAASGDPGEQAGKNPGPPGGQSRPVIAVARLAAHPGNVRGDLDLNPSFCASIAESGVLVPLRITHDGDGGYRVIEGHRRLAAALKAGLAEVPCHLAADRAGDEAGQYLDMVTANRHAIPSGPWRKPTPCSPPARRAPPGPGSARPPA